MAVKKKAHPLKGKAKSTAHRKAISEGLKRHHANKKKPSAARTKTGKIKTDKKTLAAAHSKLDAAQNRSKVRQLTKQIKQLRERITMTNGHGKRAVLFSQIDGLKAQIAKLK